MKVRHKIESIEVEVEGKDTKDCFGQIATAVEVFANTKCGACDSPRTMPMVRDVQGNTYYEMKCLDCGASLSFGQKKSDGSLFPKKKDKEGNWLDSNGWTKWKPRDEEAFEDPFSKTSRR
jgi:predicted nucleic-acid-binding Zn-ribbon protein